MRGSGHPSRPRAITCCFFASLKTLLIPTKATALRRNQRPRASFSLAGFQVTLIGRFWVTAEGADPRPSWRLKSQNKRDCNFPSWQGPPICKGCIPSSAVSSPKFRPDRPQLNVVPTAPEAVSYRWLQRRNRGWSWAMLLGVLFGGLILFFTNWLSR